LIRDQESLGQWLIAVVRYLEGRETHLSLPLESRATVFQVRVWKHLGTIPPGQPTAARAVAPACASNPVAVVIPCHRVIRRDRGQGGYRWGLKRKGKLLAQDQQFFWLTRKAL
jgi:AraC family transcriptional regulator of adaptative response/methylated-DNA-[protein]-cysteine methyltransferase